MRYQRAEQPARLDGLEAAKHFFANCFDERKSSSEQLWVAHVDRQARCLGLSSHDGGKGSVDIPVRQIIQDAAELGSAGVIIAHNHPSGDPQPSKEDLRATRRLATAAEAIDLVVIDHFVFSDRGCLSFRAFGLL